MKSLYKLVSVMVTVFVIVFAAQAAVPMAYARDDAPKHVFWEKADETKEIVVSAPASDDNDNIESRYADCPQCGSRMKAVAETWNNIWLFAGEIKCTHYHYGTDIIYEDTGVQTWQCTSRECNLINAYLIQRTKVECRGSNLQIADENAEEVPCTDYFCGTDVILTDGSRECLGYRPNAAIRLYKPADQIVQEIPCKNYTHGTDLILSDGTKECHGYDLS